MDAHDVVVAFQAPHLGALKRARPSGTASLRRVMSPPSSRSARTRERVVRACAPVNAGNGGAPTAELFAKPVQDAEEYSNVFRVWAKAAAAEASKTEHEVALDDGATFKDEEDELETTTHVVLKKNGRVIGAGRLHREGQNVRISRVTILPSERRRGYGRRLVNDMLRMCAGVEGVVYVRARRLERGFFSLLGFECQGSEEYEVRRPTPQARKSQQSFSSSTDLMRSDGDPVRMMVYSAPACAHPQGCVGLHHAQVRVRDIELSLGFYGAIGFIVSEKFISAGRCRACYVEGFGLRLKLEERVGVAEASTQSERHGGITKLVFDVTRACADLDTFLSHLRRRSGGALSVLVPPSQNVLGQNVVIHAVISDPDGVPLEFMRREATLPRELKMEW